MATLRTMARTHGIGDENWIAWPGEVVAAGNSAVASTSCRNSEGEERDFTMQPLAKSSEGAIPLCRPPVVCGLACPFSERWSIHLTLEHIEGGR
jgi:hypothetical protein